MKNNNILTDEDLSTVGSFKAIVAQGTKRPELSKQQHKNLVRSKFHDGCLKNNHITLFRVGDKKALGQKEITEHTVQGPNWTPPSSVGYVLGGMSANLRVWLATEPKDDNSGIMQVDNKPAIYFREVISPILSGYTPRMPKNGEKYGKTKKLPKLVLTPPLSRKFIESTQIQQIMNVSNDFQDLPLDKLYITNLRKLSKLDLKKKNISVDDFDADLLEDIDFDNLEPELLDLVLNKNILIFIKENELTLNEIVDLYEEFIECSEPLTNAEIFIDMYWLLSECPDDFRKLFSEINIDIVEIITLHEDEYELFCALSKGILSVYDNEIDWVDLREIYRTNKELFYSIVKDPEGAIPGIGLREFIEQFEIAQKEIDEISFDDPNYGSYDPYYWVINENNYENCPEELLIQDNDSEYDDEDRSSIEEGLIYPRNDNPYDYFATWISRFSIDEINKKLEKLEINESLNSCSNWTKESFDEINNILTQVGDVIRVHEIFEFYANDPVQTNHSFFVDEELLESINDQNQKSLEILHEARDVEHQLTGLVDYINFHTDGYLN